MPGPQVREWIAQDGAGRELGPRQAAVEPVRRERDHKMSPWPLEAQRKSAAGVDKEHVAAPQKDLFVAVDEPPFAA